MAKILVWLVGCCLTACLYCRPCSAEQETLILNSGHSAWINSLAFSKDGRLLVSGSFDHSVKLWDVSSGKELHTLSGHSDAVSSVSFSPNRDSLVSTSYDGTLKVWNPTDGALVCTFVPLDVSDWSAFDREGRFDGSNGGMNLIYWRVDSKLFPLDRFKSLYWEPRLLSKLLGLDPAPLRSVGKEPDN